MPIHSKPWLFQVVICPAQRYSWLANGFADFFFFFAGMSKKAKNQVLTTHSECNNFVCVINQTFCFLQTALFLETEPRKKNLADLKKNLYSYSNIPKGSNIHEAIPAKRAIRTADSDDSVYNVALLC